MFLDKEYLQGDQEEKKDSVQEIEASSLVPLTISPKSIQKWETAFLYITPHSLPSPSAAASKILGAIVGSCVHSSFSFSIQKSGEH